VPPPPEGQTPAPVSELSEAEEREQRFAAYEETEPAAPVAVAEVSPEPAASARTEPTLTLQQATDRLGPDILQALKTKFNGSLAEVRAPDQKDQFFR
jgi:hypothetical protein